MPRLLPAVTQFALVMSVCASTSTNIADWLSRQAKIRTWYADLTQTRSLKALTQPLTSEGRLWFAAPNQFRWELGSPPQTIAVRQSNQVLVIYPKLKRAERYPLNSGERNPMQDMLSLLEAGFPRSEADLEQRFKILSTTQEQGVIQLTVQPKAAAARRWVKEVRIRIDSAKGSLQSTSLEFADGSSMRNDFKDIKMNPPLDPKLFTPEISPDYRMAEPGSRQTR